LITTHAGSGALSKIKLLSIHLNAFVPY